MIDDRKGNARRSCIVVFVVMRMVEPERSHDIFRSNIAELPGTTIIICTIRSRRSEIFLELHHNVIRTIRTRKKKTKELKSTDRIDSVVFGEIIRDADYDWLQILVTWLANQIFKYERPRVNIIESCMGWFHAVDK